MRRAGEPPGAALWVVRAPTAGPSALTALGGGAQARNGTRLHPGLARCPPRACFQTQTGTRPHRALRAPWGGGSKAQHQPGPRPRLVSTSRQGGGGERRAGPRDHMEVQWSRGTRRARPIEDQPNGSPVTKAVQEKPRRVWMSTVTENQDDSQQSAAQGSARRCSPRGPPVPAEPLVQAEASEPRSRGRRPGDGPGPVARETQPAAGDTPRLATPGCSRA